jgi:hypothetical protein
MCSVLCDLYSTDHVSDEFLPTDIPTQLFLSNRFDHREIEGPQSGD